MRWVAPFVALLIAPPVGALQAGTAQDVITVAVVVGSADHVAGQAVVLEAYRRLGLEVEIRELDGAAALSASSSGAVDAELQRIDGIGRAHPDLVQVPIPVNYLQGAAFSIEYDFPTPGWRSLQPYRLGIVQGIIFAQEGTEGMEVAVASDYEALFDMLEAGTIDVAVTPRINGLTAVARRRAAGRDADEAIQEMEGILETLFLYHYVHRSRADLVPELTRILSDMLLDGTTRRLRDQAYAALLVGE